MTLVSSANNIGCGTEFIVRGRPFIYMYHEQERHLELIVGELFVSMHLSQREKNLS